MLLIPSVREEKRGEESRKRGGTGGTGGSDDGGVLDVDGFLLQTIQMNVLGHYCEPHDCFLTL